MSTDQEKFENLPRDFSIPVVYDNDSDIDIDD